MPDARRDESRRTEGKSECVEARSLFGGGYRDAAADTEAGAAKPGNSEHNQSRLAKQADLAAIWWGGWIGRKRISEAQKRRWSDRV